MPNQAPAGIYWQSRMGNNPDGIGGNCHRYDVVTNQARTTLVVDFGIKIHNDDTLYRCSFPDPAGLFAKRGGTGNPTDSRTADALLLTHCHEDHIGALRHAIDMGYRLPPIHCTAFTAEMVEKSLTRAGIIDPEQRPTLTIVKPGETLTINDARATFVPVDHLPGASALLLQSDEASVFHTGDYKFDSTMALGSGADMAQLRRIGKQGVDMVVADSTAAGDEAGKVSEAEIEANLRKILADQHDRAVIAGLLGTQLDRLVSLGRAARANGRAVIITGTSLCENVKAAERSGISFEQAIGAPLLTAAEAKGIAADKALVVTTGAFAQPQAGLTRAAEILPGALYVDRDTTILIPQRAIPPVAAAHKQMIGRFESMGARVINAENAPRMGYGQIHQSGHAIAADTRLLYSLLQPKRCVSPIHGAPQQIAANARLARELGIETLELPRNGALVHVGRDGAHVVETQPLPRIAAAETGLMKKLPRAKAGEGRRPPPPPVFRFDRMDERGGKVEARDVAPYGGATRHPAKAAAERGR
jgi:ribonuclease J